MVRSSTYQKQMLDQSMVKRRRGLEVEVPLFRSSVFTSGTGP